MSGFLQSIAGRYEEMISEFKRRVATFRWDSTCGTGHARTPEMIARARAKTSLTIWVRHFRSGDHHAAISLENSVSIDRLKPEPLPGARM
jgi:hypothetical protein